MYCTVENKRPWHKRHSFIIIVVNLAYGVSEHGIAVLLMKLQGINKAAMLDKSVTLLRGYLWYGGQPQYSNLLKETHSNLPHP